jgi:hypothetical protein
MALNPLFGDSARPDQARLTHTHMGLISPMWLPFMAAAGVGAAWWTMTHWARVMGAGYPGASRLSGAEGATAAREPASQPQSAQPAASPPQPAEPAAAAAVALGAVLAEQPVSDTVAESLAVQGDDGAEDAAPASVTPASMAASDKRETQAPAPKAPKAAAEVPTLKPAAKKPAPVPAPAAKADASDEHPAPTLPPHEGLPARRKGGGKKKSG